MAGIPLKPLRIPQKVVLSPHEMPPGHAHQCAYVGSLPHDQFHVILSVDNIAHADKPQLVVQIFPRFKNSNPDRESVPKVFSQMTDSHHQVTIPLNAPQRPVTQDFNHATIGRIRVKHEMALSGAATLGARFMEKNNLVALVQALTLKLGMSHFGDDFTSIKKVAQSALSAWQVR